MFFVLATIQADRYSLYLLNAISTLTTSQVSRRISNATVTASVVRELDVERSKLCSVGMVNAFNVSMLQLFIPFFTQPYDDFYRIILVVYLLAILFFKLCAGVQIVMLS